MEKQTAENKAMYETKFSHNEKVYIKKGFYKRHTGRVTDVNKKEDEYIYTVKLITETVKNDKKIETLTTELKIQEHMLSIVSDNFLSKYLIKVLGV